MKIRTKLLIGAAISTALAIGLGLIVFVSQQAVSRSLARSEVAAEFLRGVSGLNMVANDYLQHGGERPVDQWDSRLQSLRDLDPASDSKSRLDQDLDRVEETFAGLVEHREALAAGEGDPAVAQQLDDRLVSQLALHLRTLSTDSYQLAATSRAEISSSQQRGAALTLALVVIMVVVAAGTGLATLLRISNPLMRLTQAAEAIAQGDFYARADTASKDEVGVLAQAFNTMTIRLKETFGSLEKATSELQRSNARLRQEVAERGQAEEKFSRMLEFAPDAVIVANEDGKIVLVNSQASSVFGYAREELIGQPVESLMPERFRATHGQHRAGYSTHASPREMGAGLALQALRKDGGEFPVEISLSPLETDEGLLVMSAVRDITERKRTEETIRIYQDIVSNMQVGLMVFQLDDLADERTLRLVAANPAATTVSGMKGVNMDALIGKTVGEAFPALLDTDIPEKYAEVIRSGKPTVLNEIVYGDHRVPEGVFSVKAFPLPNSTVGVAFENVTERKLALDALQNSEERFRSLVDNAADGIVIVDGGGSIVLANDAAEEMFGFARSELIGQPLETLVPEDAQEAHREHRNDYRSHPSPRSHRGLRARRKDGSEFPAEISLTPLKVKAGQLVAATVSDITDRRRAEEEIRRKAEDLARSNGELEQFAYVASHDLQEPLRMVASYTQLLGQRYQGRLDADADDFIAYAVDGAKRMQGLIEGLLAFSRVVTKGGEFEPSDAEAALQHALTNLELLMKESGAVVTHDALPTLEVDGVQLAQVFQNLIENAIKFRGEVPPRVHISAEQQGDDWVFSVADNGIGIDPEYAERIFAIFQRLHSSEERSGHGLGLAICKRIIERHRGRIWVESEAGKGATFSFSIPTGTEAQLAA